MAASAAQQPIPPVTTLRGVGPALAARLQKLGIMDVRDLLLHAPLRCEDRSRITPIGSAPAGKVQIEGEVVMTDISGRRRRMLVCVLRDGTGSIELRFFHFSPSLRHRLVPGSHWRCYGEVKTSPSGREMIHPEIQPATGQAGHILPVYPATAGLSQKSLRRLIAGALGVLEGAPAWLPRLPAAAFPEELAFPLEEALRQVHQPPPASDASAYNEGRLPGQRRLAFEELVAHQLAFRSRARVHAEENAPMLEISQALLQQFVDRLPFTLTAAQWRVFGEIREDLGKTVPMGRLIQGDVGSGKTVVAALAALTAWQNGWQTAVMAPTELLAEQHWGTWSEWLAPLGLKSVLLTSRQGGKERGRLLAELLAGKVDVLIGTHALFQEEVRFCRLGLVVVDEQHRFGVDQRLALKSKADQEKPHYLVMTATPIPRTLAMLRYGDMDISLIDELPPGREPVETRVMSEEKRPRLIARLRRWIVAGRQAYWVCTLIEESEALAAEAAEKTAVLLQEELDGLRVGLVHGRMKAEDKEAVMAAFKAGAIDLLVATTVIEVGVDVPNAGLMVIENSERLGLAQLHQLRGRVGRGGGQSFCILFYRPPLSATAQRRLAILRDCHDGFVLAEKDLALRGPGELLGTRQSGALRFKMADPVRDRDVLPRVRDAAEWLQRNAPEAVPALLAFWLGEGNRYVDV